MKRVPSQYICATRSPVVLRLEALHRLALEENLRPETDPG